ncbi:hypothetical protein BDV06DRAFT_182080 [Aspergillus oleicola]
MLRGSISSIDLRPRWHLWVWTWKSPLFCCLFVAFAAPRKMRYTLPMEIDENGPDATSDGKILFQSCMSSA